MFVIYVTRFYLNSQPPYVVCVYWGTPGRMISFYWNVGKETHISECFPVGRVLFLQVYETNAIFIERSLNEWDFKLDKMQVMKLVEKLNIHMWQQNIILYFNGEIYSMVRHYFWVKRLNFWLFSLDPSGVIFDLKGWGTMCDRGSGRQ